MRWVGTVSRCRPATGIFAVLLLIAVAGCTTAVEGTYVSETTPPRSVSRAATQHAAPQVTPGRVRFDDPSIRYSPFSWRDGDEGRRGNAGAHLAALIQSKKIDIDIDSPGTIAYRVNSEAWQYAPGDGLVRVRLSPDKTWNTNLVEVVLVDSWADFRGFVVDRTGAARQLPDPGGPRILALGDSITEGGSVGPTGAAHGTNALLAYPAALRDLLGAQVGISASGGRGWLNNSPLSTTWADFDVGQMDLSDPPQAIVIMAGGGEPNAPGLAKAVRSTLADMRKRLPSTQLLVLGHTNASSPAVATINDTVKAMDDQRVHFVDAAPWIKLDSDTTDGVHHAGFVGRAIMAPHIARELRRMIPTTPPD